jgi:hypothetical protein
MVATAVLLLLQPPPLMLAVRLVVAASHTVAVPLMVPAAGAGFTVILLVAIAVPQLLVTE